MASVALSEAEKVYIVHGVQVEVAAESAGLIAQGGGAGRPRGQDGRPRLCAVASVRPVHLDRHCSRDGGDS